MASNGPKPGGYAVARATKATKRERPASLLQASRPDRFSSDAKGRLTRAKRGPARFVNRRRGQLAAIINRHDPNGDFSYIDRAPSGKKSGVVFGVTGPQGGISSNPAASVAWRIRNALAAPPIPPCIIYDAAGKAVATMDPITRQRTPL